MMKWQEKVKRDFGGVSRRRDCLALVAFYAVLCGMQFIVVSVFAEVAGLDHIKHISVSSCKPSTDETPKNTPVGNLCSYSQRQCDVADGKKRLLHAVQIDVDCLALKSGKCPKIGECAKAKLPENVAEFVRSQNDPNSNFSRSDGAIGPEASPKDKK